MNDDLLFSLKLTQEQYNELAQLWHEYTLLGPTRNAAEGGWNALDFLEWLYPDLADQEDKYGLPEVESFLLAKEWREGTALPEWATLDAQERGIT